MKNVTLSSYLGNRDKSTTPMGWKSAHPYTVRCPCEMFTTSFLCFEPAGQWMPSDPSRSWPLTLLCSVCLEYHLARLPTLQTLTYEVQPKVFARKIFLKTLGHSNLFFSELTDFTACCNTELVFSQRQILWDPIWLSSPCLIMKFFLLMYILSP